MSNETGDKASLGYSFSLGAPGYRTGPQTASPDPATPPDPATSSDPAIQAVGSADAAEGSGEIEFVCDPALKGLIPEPERASRFLPDWFRSLQRDMGMPDPNGLPGLTVKACLPVTDAFTLGWIVPLPFSVRILVPEDRVNIQMGWAEDVPFQPVEQHHPGQIGAPAAPFAQTMPLKWMNPWQIRVPDGYSVLFTPPFNHFQLPFTCFTGLVDCDRFTPRINFPFAWTGAPGDYTLPAGTPLVQVVPIQRTSLPTGHTVRASSEVERRELADATDRKFNEESVYRREWRERK